LILDKFFDVLIIFYKKFLFSASIKELDGNAYLMFVDIFLIDNMNDAFLFKGYGFLIGDSLTFVEKDYLFMWDRNLLPYDISDLTK
jgi:hypothetical protein